MLGPVLLPSTGTLEKHLRLWPLLKPLGTLPQTRPHPWCLHMFPKSPILLAMAGLAHGTVLNGRCALADAVICAVDSSDRESLQGAGAPVRCAAIAAVQVGMDAMCECPAFRILTCRDVDWSYAITAPISASKSFSGLKHMSMGHHDDISAAVCDKGSRASTCPSSVAATIPWRWKETVAQMCDDLMPLAGTSCWSAKMERKLAYTLPTPRNTLHVTMSIHGHDVSAGVCYKGSSLRPPILLGRSLKSQAP